MSKLACLAAMLVLTMAVSSAAQGARPSYDFRERTRVLAFDPARYFPERSRPAMSLRYMGDDYGYPVYAIAVRKGCIDADTGAARRTCGGRMTARMVRAPYEGEPPRPRARGQRLFASLAASNAQSDEALRPLLDRAKLDWLEADVRACPAAMAHLVTGRDLRFSPAIDPTNSSLELPLHAAKMTFEVDAYLTRSRYEGWLKPGSPAAWADAFAASLAGCWKPSAASVPWSATTGDRAQQRRESLSAPRQAAPRASANAPR